MFNTKITVTTHKTYGLRLGKLACTENHKQVSRDGIQEPGALGVRAPLGSTTTKVLYKQ